MSRGFTRSKNKGVITLEGELTLPHAAEMRKTFLKALLDSDDVSIAFGNVQDADLSCLQLLCCAHRSAVRLKKRVRFAGALPRIFEDLAKAAGFSRQQGCRRMCEKSCLWIGVVGA